MEKAVGTTTTTTTSPAATPGGSYSDRRIGHVLQEGPVEQLLHVNPPVSG